VSSECTGKSDPACPRPRRRPENLQPGTQRTSLGDQGLRVSQDMWPPSPWPPADAPCPCQLLWEGRPGCVLPSGRGFGRPAWEAHRTPASGGAGGPALCKPPHTPLSDPQTCPGPGPPLSAVIRVMAHICPTDGDRISKHLCFQTPKGQRKERQPRAAPAWSRGPGSAVGVLLAHKVPSQLLAVSRPEASMVRPVAPFLGSSPDPTSFYLFIYFCSIRALTQGLPLEPLPQPFL
jgi:hypothetical protein